MRIASLYNLTEYSLLESTNQISKLVNKAKASGYSALAITDTSMSGAFKFYQAALKAEIKPILGLKVPIERENSYLLFYAKNKRGYQELLELDTLQKQKLIELSDLKATNDLVVVIPHLENDLSRLILTTDIIGANILVRKYQELFSDLYFGLSQTSNLEKDSSEVLLSYFKSLGIEAVAISQSRYLKESDLDAYRIVNALRTNNFSYELNSEETNMYFLEKDYFRDLFRKYDEALANTQSIADKVNLELKFEGYLLPAFETPNNDSDEYLDSLCKFGLNKRLRGRHVNQELYVARLLEELETIKSMGFSDYFLVVYDFIRFAKQNDILVGPGRGSAPGSLVAYSLGITEIDPISNGLLFERFLNKERITMPDIDTDFPDNKRELVIQYLGEKYGLNKVAHISAFSTFKAKQAVRDVARVLNLDNTSLSEVMKHISSTRSLQESITTSTALQRLIKENKEIYNVIDLALKIEGLPRHYSTHAAGVVMTDDDLVKHTSLIKSTDNIMQTVYEAEDLEKLGLVKIDILGLRNLTIIEEVIEYIKENEKGEFNLYQISLNDQEVFKLFQKADTDGIFQFESSGMRNLLRDMHPDSFSDIVVAIALYRPGPMAMIPEFVSRKKDKRSITYLHADLKDILEETYGVIVFQEQVMLILQKIGGYSLGEADVVRRAISKKDKALMEKERTKFIARSKKMEYSQNIGEQIFDLIFEFASYGFNKSHATAYALVAYQMAYLKTYYYKYFMTVLMSYNLGSSSLNQDYIYEAKSKGLVIKSPDINISKDKFVFKDQYIYYPLLGIKGIGEITCKDLLEERKANGKYEDYYSFIERTKDILSETNVMTLIDSCSLDSFGLTHKFMVEEYNNAYNIAKFSSAFKSKMVRKEPSKDEFSLEENNLREKEALGFNLKYSLFGGYEHIKRKYNLPNLNQLTVRRNQQLLFAIKRIKIIKTKNNEEMAFLEIYDDTAIIDAVIFPATYQKYQGILEEKKIYLGLGNLEMRKGKMQYIVNELTRRIQ